MLEKLKELKERHPGMLILFRVGDFYEAYGEDAESISTLLGLPLPGISTRSTG